MKSMSLKTRFIIMTVALYVAVGLVMLFAFSRVSMKIINGFATRFAVKEALLGKNRINSVIEREVALALKMADDNALKSWVADEKNAAKRSMAFEELESYRRFFRDRSFFIALASSNNYYVYNKGKGRAGVDVVRLDSGKSDDTWFFDGIRHIDGYALNLDYNPTLRETKVWINAVMSTDGIRTGICGSGINITDFLNEIVLSNDKGISAVLVDSRGIIQAHEDRKIVDTNAVTRDPGRKITVYSLMQDDAERKTLTQSIERLVSGKSVVEAFPAKFGGNGYLVAVTYMPGIKWLNIVLVDVSKVIAMKEFIPFTVILLASMLLLVTIIALFMNRMVLDPLRRLNEASNKVASGDFNIAVPVERADEVGELSASFNAMAGTIQDYTGNLEKKVRERTVELHEANRLLEASQSRINESIAYAGKIQAAILPSAESLRRCLGDYFVLYSPKASVGGDFYFLREFPGHFVLACVDCTGHGVPGAFMTMTAYAVLNQAVDTISAGNPADILSGVNRIMKKNLDLQDTDAGLDIALCVVDRMKSRVLFAGAGLPIFRVSAVGCVDEFKGNRTHIGYRNSSEEMVFDVQEILLSPGDACYLLTDGIVDEPGGDKGYGFGYIRFRNVISSHAGMDMQSRMRQLETAVSAYRGSYDRRDDMTVIAFKASEYLVGGYDGPVCIKG